MPRNSFANYLNTYLNTETPDRKESIAKSIQRFANEQTPGNARRILNGYTMEYNGLNDLHNLIINCPAEKLTAEFLTDIYQKILLQGYADLFDATGEIHQAIQQLFLQANIPIDTIKSLAFKQNLLSGYITNFLPSHALGVKQKEIFAQAIAEGNTDGNGNIANLDAVIIPISLFQKIMTRGEDTTLPQLLTYPPTIVLTAAKLQLTPETLIAKLNNNKFLQGSLDRLCKDSANPKLTLELFTATELWLTVNEKKGHKDLHLITTLHNHLENQLLQIKDNKTLHHQLIQTLFNLQHYAQSATKETHDSASNINALFRNTLHLNDPHHPLTLKDLPTDELIKLFQEIRDIAKTAKKDAVLKAVAKTSLLAENTIAGKTYSLDGLAKEIPPAASSPMQQSATRQRSNALSSYISTPESSSAGSDIPSSSSMPSSSSTPASSEASSSNSWIPYRPTR